MFTYLLCGCLCGGVIKAVAVAGVPLHGMHKITIIIIIIIITIVITTTIIIIIIIIIVIFFSYKALLSNQN